MRQSWDLWIPDAASRGITFARGVTAPTEQLWVHAAPTLLSVEVRDEAGVRVASGESLPRRSDVPMTRLQARDGRVTREEAWPAQSDLGGLVILPGGEVGVLTAWWNDPEGREWRWSVEFHNRR